MNLLPLLPAVLLPANWAYQVLTVVCAYRWSLSGARWPSLSPDASPAVSLLKPLCGSDPDLAANLRSFCTQEYPAYQILFGALDEGDPALDVARQMQHEFRELDIAVVSGGEEFGLNRKVCNLHQMLPHAKHDLLVLSDSDMRVEPDYLSRVVAPFGSPSVGLVTCPYRGHDARGLASRLEALGIGGDFLPSAFVAYYLWKVRFAFGSTIVIRRTVLEKMGGFEVLADELADDYRLAEAATSQGQEVVLSTYVVNDVLGRESFGEMWSRRLRWAKTARAMRPGPYAGSFITHGTALSLLLLLGTWGSLPAIWGAVVTLLLRFLCTVVIGRGMTRDAETVRSLWLLPVSDLVSFCLYVGSFFGRTLVWRGKSVTLGKDGRLT